MTSRAVHEPVAHDPRPMLKIAIIIGTTRPGRLGTAVGEWAYDLARPRDDADFALLDVWIY